jgi:predicted TIM-barrel fold metal-dependent hydrolase
VLDQAGVDITLIITPGLGPGQSAPRFLCVPQADGLLFPFASSDERINWFRKGFNLDSLPTSLNEYQERIRNQLEQWKKAGAVAIKFACAYSRPLDFALVSEEEANRVYESHRQDRKPSAKDYKILQDFLFGSLAREAGRLGLVVQIHTGIGAERYFNISGSNPMLLEPMLNDVALRQTNFVMVHGGWPFEREAGVMLIKSNVYADFSAQLFLRSAEAVSEVLRAWLEWYPEKILFGTDAYSEDTPLANWEEKLWLTSRTARQALALALTRMITAGQITRPRAEELAHMILHDNAAKLYRLEGRRTE